MCKNALSSVVLIRAVNHFDTAACLIMISELKTVWKWERTPQEMLLQLTLNPLNNQAFSKEAFQLGA